LVFEFDHSQYHKRFDDNIHIVKYFNLNPGGAVLFVRSIVVNPNSLGIYNHLSKVKPNKMMHHTFGINDPPPKSKPDMPKFDYYENPKIYDISTKELKLELKKANLETSSNVSNLHHRYKNATLPIPTKKKYGKLVKGYVDMQIRLIEVL